MPKRKLEIKATDEQLNELYKALEKGAPLQLALLKGNINLATYYYWVALASIVKTVKSQQEIEELEEIANSGISIQNVRDLAANSSRGKRTSVGAFIEPSAESLLRYKISVKFRKFADKCYDIIVECDKARTTYAFKQLSILETSNYHKQTMNPSASMWWLERNLPDFFAKPSDKAKEEENKGEVDIPSIKVEFVDPGTSSSQQRLIDMENEILSEQKGGKA